MGRATLVAGDWGTSRLRLFLCDADGAAVDTIDGPGASEARDRFAKLFDSLLIDWMSQHGPLPAILCGMRWSDSRKEVALFGVNYTAPFAHAFRAHQRLGIPIDKAIDADVYHLARLGLDAYRVHVWDREITDAEGNVLANEHANQ